MIKTKLISHRVNSITQLQKCPQRFGVEIDVRNHGSELIVTHDPFDMNGPKLQDWLAEYKHNFLIVNVKEEGLEPQVLKHLALHEIKEYFILDESLPYIRKYALAGVSNFAVRYSEIEAAQTAINLQADLKKHNQHIEWVWCDSFNGAPPMEADIKALRNAKLKICQVSPELHFVGEPSLWEKKIENFHKILMECYQDDFRPDMVCTKCPDLWLEFLSN